MDELKKKRCCQDSWEKGYLRAITNMKVLMGKYLTHFTKPPFKIQNGSNNLTSKELKAGLDSKIKKHLERKQKAKVKIYEVRTTHDNIKKDKRLSQRK